MLVAKLLERVANRDDRPRWKDTSFFKRFAQSGPRRADGSARNLETTRDPALMASAAASNGPVSSRGSPVYRPKFNVATILLVLPVIAIGWVAMLRPSDLWASTLFTFTLGLLAVATLCAILARPHHRPAWIGFAVFGWCYLIFIFMYVDYRLSLRPVRFPQLLPDLMVGLFVPENTPESYYLKGIVHSMATALAGVIGSWVGGFIASRGPDEGTGSSGDRGT